MRFQLHSMLLVAGVLLARPASAQGRPAATNVVFAILDDSSSQPAARKLLRSDAPLYVIRHPGGQQANVVVLRRSTATSGMVNLAIGVLRRSIQDDGATVDAKRWMVLRTQVGESTDSVTRAFFRQLLTAARTPVRELGQLPAISTTLPADTTGAKLTGKGS